MRDSKPSLLLLGPLSPPQVTAASPPVTSRGCRRMPYTHIFGKPVRHLAAGKGGEWICGWQGAAALAGRCEGEEALRPCDQSGADPAGPPLLILLIDLLMG